MMRKLLLSAIAAAASGLIVAALGLGLTSVQAPGTMRGTSVDCGSPFRPAVLEDEAPSVGQVCAERRRARLPLASGLVGLGIGIGIGAGTALGAGRIGRRDGFSCGGVR